MGNLDLLEDACASLPHTTRAMFGGHGLFAPNGGMFAGIVTDDCIVLKLAQDAPRAELIALGGVPWVYNGKMTMRDWIVVPDSFYDEPRELAAWARRAHAIAPPKNATTRRAPTKEAPAKRPAARTPPKRAVAKRAAPKKAPVKKAPAKSAKRKR